MPAPVWGIMRNNFDFDYVKRRDFVRGIDGEFAFGDIFPVISEKGFTATIGGSFVSKYEKSENDIYIDIYPGGEQAIGIIPAGKIPANVACWSTRLNFGYEGFRFEAEFAQKVNDPNATNGYIYKKGNALFLSATYSMKGLGVSASFIRSEIGRAHV